MIERADPPESSQLDLLLGDRIRLRLRDAGTAQLAAATRQFGIDPIPASGSAHLTIRYVEKLPGTLQLIGHDAGWIDDRFFLLRGGRRATLAFDAIGTPDFTIECERAIGLPPQIVPIVNVVALANGILPLHASAAVLAGQGVAFAGWSKGGKTEALLAAMEAGGDPVADEWLFVDPATRSMTTMLQPIRLEDVHLAQLPRHRAEIGRGKRAVIAAASALGRQFDAFAGTRAARRRPVRWMHRLGPFVEARRHVDLPASRFLRAPVGTRVRRLDRVILIGSSTQPRTTARDVDRSTVVARMAMAHQHHRSNLLDAYQMFLFAFPERHSSVMDRLEHLETAMLEAALPLQASDFIEHPYPASIRELRDIIVRLLDVSAA